MFTVAKILSGSDSAFSGNESSCPQVVCETWYCNNKNTTSVVLGYEQLTCFCRYEWMVGKLLYTNPTVKYFELALYAEEAIAKFGGLSSMTALDSVVLAAFQVLLRT